MTDLFDLRGNVVLVTGAASGIGLAFSEALAGAGAHVVMLDVDESGVASAAAELERAGGSVRAARADITQPAEMDRIVCETVEAHGRLDAVFANAGISGGPSLTTPAGSIVNADLAAFDRVLQVNVKGTFITVQAAARAMIPQQRGRIIITTSAVALRASPIAYGYAIGKAGVMHLVKQAALELAPHGIAVMGIAPGPVGTNIGGGTLRDPSNRARLAGDVLLGRVADPAELRTAALYLASPHTTYVTGTVLVVDGGASA